MNNLGNLIITGAAGTIGRAVAKLLAPQYNELFLLDRNASILKEISDELPNSVPISMDVLDNVALETAFLRASRGRLAAVVLAVGVEGPIGHLEDCLETDFDNVMNLNVKSVWLGLKQSLGIMKPQGGGSVVVLSSISGVMGAPMLAPYSASKHAVMGLVRTAAREAAAFGVRVNAVCPAPVSSDMMRRIDQALQERFPERLGGRRDAVSSVPMQRYAEPEEIARSIAFLCSPESSFCSGSAFMVDGGMSCR
jgi:NAD(P)-dependent dehydrogenase (short-subunit alcohol dehydrogenase family)